MAYLSQDVTTSLVPSRFTTNEERAIKRALKLIESKRLRGVPVLQYMEDYTRYLLLRFAGKTNEEGHTLYLNINYELLAAETENYGCQKSVTRDIRQVVLRAITLGAEYVVFAHNHPNENPNPSDADLNNLGWLEKALSSLNITLLDSLVVTSSQVTSIKTYRKRMEEMESRERSERWERERLERQAKRAANKAAKLAAQLQGETA